MYADICQQIRRQIFDSQSYFHLRISFKSFITIVAGLTLCPIPYGCRLSDAEAAVVQSAGIPRQVLSGKYDPIAGQRYAQWLADHLDCPLLTMGARIIYALSTRSVSDLLGVLLLAVSGLPKCYQRDYRLCQMQML